MMVDIVGERTAAIERLVREEHARLVRAVALACGSVPAAEDAVQEALARAWDRLTTGGAIDHLGGWVVTVAMNLTRSAHRQARRTTSLPSGLSSPGAQGRTAELVDLERAVAALPDRQRQVVVLHYYLDHDVRTVAALLDVSEGATKNALFHARAALARALGETDGGDPR